MKGQRQGKRKYLWEDDTYGIRTVKADEDIEKCVRMKVVI